MMCSYDGNGQAIIANTCSANSIGGAVLHGNGSPVANGIAPVPGSMYINDVDGTIWAVVNSQWQQEV